jgi:LmbE family N-acetylglucosaminyl deacetylase
VGARFVRAEARLRVLAVAAHPDDAETGCGGTLARYSAAGHRVTVAYLTRGEAGIEGKGPRAAAAIRSAEAEAACRILGATPRFLGQIDGATVLDSRRVQAMERALRAEAPDVVLTHWPVDAHMDHAITGVLTMQALVASRLPAALFFFEVMTGEQTRSFGPTAYVDIGAVRERKRLAVACHRSQDAEAIYLRHHEPMERRRGREAGVAFAEAFVAAEGFGPPGSAPGPGLPGLPLAAP